jgi:threonine dehydratase
LPSLDELSEARRRVEGVASRTPLVESPSLSKRVGRRVFLKLECFQPIGVFKVRGAYNKISQTSKADVVAASSGNHGIAVAYASRLLGKRCTIVVPETIVKEKLGKMKEYGGNVVKFGRYSDERELKAKSIAEESKAAFIHPFNDRQVIAGQGTAGLEIAEQLSKFDSVIVPVGGGGLISGIATAIKSLKPSVKVFGAEPEGAAKLGAALKAGHPVRLEHPSSVADGLITRAIGELPFGICRSLVDGAFAASDDQIMSAMRLLAHEAHIFAEPSAAVPLAVLLSERENTWLGQRVVLLVSGGNISLNLLKKIL